jgi:hypothetical protein
VRIRGESEGLGKVSNIWQVSEIVLARKEKKV